MILSVLDDEEFEDTKGVIRIRKSKKDRQHYDQMEKDKRTNIDLQTIHIKLKIYSHEPNLNTGGELMGFRKGRQFLFRKRVMRTEFDIYIFITSMMMLELPAY